MMGGFRGASVKGRFAQTPTSFSNGRIAIASEAKQSISPRKERMDCFAPLAMTISRHAYKSRGAKATEAKVRAWVEEKKTMTHDKIAQWKEQGDAKRLVARADLSENYAVTAMEIAAAAVDEAERAAVEAVVARMDADGIKAPAASKSA
jgi:hypothetical protein